MKNIKVKILLSVLILLSITFSIAKLSHKEIGPDNNVKQKMDQISKFISDKKKNNLKELNQRMEVTPKVKLLEQTLSIYSSKQGNIFFDEENFNKNIVKNWIYLKEGIKNTLFEAEDLETIANMSDLALKRPKEILKRINTFDILKIAFENDLSNDVKEEANQILKEFVLSKTYKKARSVNAKRVIISEMREAMESIASKDIHEAIDLLHKIDNKKLKDILKTAAVIGQIDRGISSKETLRLYPELDDNL